MSSVLKRPGGYASGSCPKHHVPLIHTITEQTYCAVCEAARSNRLGVAVDRLQEQVADHTKEIARLREALTAIRDRGKGIGGAVVVTETMLRKIAAQALDATKAGGEE